MSILLGSGYSTNQMGYNLARLRRNRLIRRLTGSNTHRLTPEGQRIAIFNTRSTLGSCAPSPPTSRPHPPNSATP